MSIFSSIGEMWYRWGREVAIFWDHENCPIPSGEGAGFFVKRIYDAASRYGTVKLFKAYDNAQSIKTLSNLGKALGMYKGEVISCPGDGKRNVADRAILVDIPTYLLDVGDLKAKLTTIILITSDGDYLRVVQKLRERNVEVIVILPHQCNRQLRELGSKSLVWEHVSGLAAEEWGREVAIFWDHELCPIPSGKGAEIIVKKIYDTASRYGTVKSFKAYDNAQSVKTLSNLGKALGMYKGEVISCPGDGKRNVADRAISVDIPTYLLDLGDKAKSTRIILITGDGDYLRVVQTLRKRDVEVIVIVPHQCKRPLRELGSKSLVWEDVSGLAPKEWGREVAIFWDHEMCPIPSGTGAENIVKRIYDTASRHGTVKSFKAYDKAQPVNTLFNLKKALGVYKGEVISCPGDGKRNVADRAISVDIPTYLLDIGDKAKSTRIILITGDGDYLRVVQKLRERNVEVIVILPHQCKRPLGELGSKSLIWEDMTGITAKKYQWGREVAIFWDHENCAVPSGERYEDVVNRVYDASKVYGTVKLFKAYDHPQQEPVKTLFEKALDRHGGRVISCPNNGKPDVVDKAIFVDIPMYLLDIGDRADSTTIVLITGDVDYLRVVEELRGRGVEVVVIVPHQSNSQLRELASDSLSWEEVSGIDSDQMAQDGNLSQAAISKNIDKFGLLVVMLFNHELQGRVLYVSRSYAGQQFAGLKKLFPDVYTAVGCRNFREYIKCATDRNVVITSPAGANAGEPWISLHPQARSVMEMFKQQNRTLQFT